MHSGENVNIRVEYEEISPYGFDRKSKIWDSIQISCDRAKAWSDKFKYMTWDYNYVFPGRNCANFAGGVFEALKRECP